MPATHVGRLWKRLEDQRLLRDEATFIDDVKLKTTYAGKQDRNGCREL